MQFNRDIFRSRREFFKILIGLFYEGRFGGRTADDQCPIVCRLLKKQLLPVGTDPSRLYDEDPKYLDTRNLEITPMIKFDTMGDSQIEVDLEKWRLEVTGEVQKPLQLSYPEILKLPPIKRKVLLICAGLFSYHAEYTGISLRHLLEMSDAAKEVSRLTFYGRTEFIVDKKERYGISEITEDKLFLAYSVNGQPLPRQHGFSMRLVADDHCGNRWVKYVYKVKIN